MKILRNAAVTSAALVLGVGAVAHASSNHRDDKPTGYYGHSSGSHHSDDNRNAYYGQPNTTSVRAAATTGVKALQRQVLAKQVNGAYLFASKTLKIKAGTTITWLNKSDAAHNVTFDKNTKVNMDFEPNKSVSYTFAKAGIYRYHCEYHPYMKGTVTVS